MMAFFLLMWLINTTSPQAKRGIADYLAPGQRSRSRPPASAASCSAPPWATNGSKSNGSMSAIEQLAPEARRPPRIRPEQQQVRQHADTASEDALKAALEKREDSCLRKRRPVPAPGDAGHAGTGRALQAGA